MDIINFLIGLIVNWLKIHWFEVLIIIIGWRVVSWQQRKNLANGARMKIYENFYLVKNQLDKSFINLGLKLNKFQLPFLEMSFSDNALTSAEKKLKDLEIWRKHVNATAREIYKFNNRYSALWALSETWIGAFPNLKKAKKELFDIQLADLTKKLYEYHEYLQSQPSKQFDWQLWKKMEIESATEDVGNLFNKIAVGYIEDYFVLIHNELVYPILGHKKTHRENFANMDKLKSYSILTESGLKEIIK